MALTFAFPKRETVLNNYAEVAQLVEHNLAKVGVAGSNLVFCSKKIPDPTRGLEFFFPCSF